MKTPFHYDPYLYRFKEMGNKKIPVSGSDYESLLAVKQEKQLANKKQSSLFFLIGLSLSLLMVIVVFEWKFYDRVEPIDLSTSMSEDFQEVLDIPLTKQPIKPPTQQHYQLVEIPDEEILLEEIKIDLDVEVNEETAIKDVVYELTVEEIPEEEAEEIFLIVEEEAQPIGGVAAFYAFITENLKYPKMAVKGGIEGKVFVQFVVEKDGSVSQIEVIKGIGWGCDEEAKRVLAMAPGWHPAKQRGMPVRMKKIIPINFQLKVSS